MKLRVNQLRNQLRRMHRLESADSLDLDDHLLFHEEI